MLFIDHDLNLGESLSWYVLEGGLGEQHPCIVVTRKDNEVFNEARLHLESSCQSNGADAKDFTLVHGDKRGKVGSVVSQGFYTLYCDLEGFPCECCKVVFVGKVEMPELEFSSDDFDAWRTSWPCFMRLCKVGLEVDLLIELLDAPSLRTIHLVLDFAMCTGYMFVDCWRVTMLLSASKRTFVISERLAVFSCIVLLDRTSARYD